MSVEELYSIEIEGVSNTIKSYTVESYIHSYSNQLTLYQLPSDYKKISIIVSRLLEWYEENIEQILSSKFVMNKEEHLKSKDVLNELKILLHTYNV